MKNGFFTRIAMALGLVLLIPLASAAGGLDLSTNETRLAYVEALLEKYPNIVRANLQYRRNLIQVLAQFHDLSQKLGPNLTELSHRTLSSMELIYAPGGTVAPNEKAISDLKRGFRSDVDLLPLPLLKGFKEDLAALAELSVRDGKPDAETYKKNVARLIRQAPLLYDAKGEPIAGGAAWKTAAQQRLASAQAGDLDNLYGDMFTQHQLPALKDAVEADEKRTGMLRQVLQTQANGLKKSVPAATRPIVMGAVTGSRYLRLEEVLTPVDVFRGCFGKDCSILSVPFFPAVKGTKTYFVHKAKVVGAAPEGYLFVAPVEVNGKKLPYVITANGNLTSEDVKKALQAVALDWGVDEYVRPDFKIAPNVVNAQGMRTGLASDAGQKVRVEMPAGWSEVSSFIKEHGTGYQNYYAAESLESAYLEKISVDSPDLLAPIQRTVTEALPAQSSGILYQRPTFDRALVAAGVINGDKASAQRAFVMQRLNVTPEQLAAAEELQSPHFGIDRGLYGRLQKEFGFGFRDLETLDVAKWMFSLNRLHKEDEEIASAAEWARSYERLWSDVTKDWLQTPPEKRPQLLASLRGWLLDVPEPYRAFGKDFVDDVIRWGVNPENIEKVGVLDVFLENKFLSKEQLQRLGPKLVASSDKLDWSKLSSYLKGLARNLRDWPEEEQRATWLAWVKVAAGLKARGGIVLNAVPERFRGAEWMEASVHLSDLGLGTEAYLKFVADHPSLGAAEREAVARTEAHLLERARKIISGEKFYGDPASVEAVLSLLSRPELKGKLVAQLGEKEIKRQVFRIIPRDTGSFFAGAGKYHYLHRIGWLEDFLKEQGSVAAWWREDAGFAMAKSLRDLLLDPTLPASTRELLRGTIQKEAAVRYRDFVWRGKGGGLGNYSVVIGSADFKNPYLRDLLGQEMYDEILEKLRRELLDHAGDLSISGQVVLRGKLKSLALTAPPEAAAPVYAYLEKTGNAERDDELRKGFGARLAKEPALAEEYRRATHPSAGQTLVRAVESCSRLYGKVRREFRNDPISY